MTTFEYISLFCTYLEKEALQFLEDITLLALKCYVVWRHTTGSTHSFITNVKTVSCLASNLAEEFGL